MVLLMKKLLGILVLGLLFSGNSYAKTITLHKCVDIEDNISSYEKNYYTINLKKKEITHVLVYSDKSFKAMREAFEKEPELKDSLTSIQKINTSKTYIYFNDENYIRSKEQNLFSDALEKINIDIDLKKLRVISQYNLYNKIKKENTLNSIVTYKCVMKK